MNKKYILIQNDGEIETNSFELIGASTKRGEAGKIGFFGSGLKYSIAYMMRKGIEFRIFSGLNELKFSTSKELLKGKDFERICINGKETSYTVTMGPTWREDWFVLREIYCNALDEGGCTLVKDIETTAPSQGKTRIYIELTGQLRRVIDNWDAYFADERTPLFIAHDIYCSYMGWEDGPQKTNQSVSVYRKTNGTLYRRGIRVHNNDGYMFDYGLTYVDINEDRTAKNTYGLRNMVANLFSSFSNVEYIKSVLRTGAVETTSNEFQYLHTSDLNNEVSEEWIPFSKENLLVVREKSGKYYEQINTSTKEVFLIPSVFARLLKMNKPDICILGMGSVVGDVGFTEIEPTSKMSFLLKEVLSSLSEMRYVVPYEIHIAEFESDKTLGHADIEGKKIYIASSTFDMGRREIAMTIMEETEHIRSKAHDETRRFETHIFSQWLKSMEEANGLFL